jgi:hypothetical protein
VESGIISGRVGGVACLGREPQLSTAYVRLVAGLEGLFDAQVRTTMGQQTKSVIPARPVTRHQPGAIVVREGSLIEALARSAGGAPGVALAHKGPRWPWRCLVFAPTVGGTVIVLSEQRRGTICGGSNTSGRSSGRDIDSGRSKQRTLAVIAGQERR